MRLEHVLWLIGLFLVRLCEPVKDSTEDTKFIAWRLFVLFSSAVFEFIWRLLTADYGAFKVGAWWANRSGVVNRSRTTFVRLSLFRVGVWRQQLRCQVLEARPANVLVDRTRVLPLEAFAHVNVVDVIANSIGTFILRGCVWNGVFPVLDLFAAIFLPLAIRGTTSNLVVALSTAHGRNMWVWEGISAASVLDPTRSFVLLGHSILCE